MPFNQEYLGAQAAAHFQQGYSVGEVRGAMSFWRSSGTEK
jgi:hypothetical protein